MSYDVKCLSLAEAFLGDLEIPTAEGYRQAGDELAQTIQDAIEGWISTSGLEEKR